MSLGALAFHWRIVEDAGLAMAGQSLLPRLDARQSAPGVIDGRQAGTLRLNQPRTAAR
jgi:hypothetical protein